MSDAFFLPIGRDIVVHTISKNSFHGELKGIINFGGIPAIWIEQFDDMVKRQFIFLIQNVVAIEIDKGNNETIILDGGMLS